jgi:hypothetical protein
VVAVGVAVGVVVAVVVAVKKHEMTIAAERRGGGK